MCVNVCLGLCLYIYASLCLYDQAGSGWVWSVRRCICFSCMSVCVSECVSGFVFVHLCVFVYVFQCVRLG